MYPYTPLHDVNVTSISTTQELTTLIFFILDKFIFWSLLGGGGGIDIVLSLHTHRFGQKSTSIPAPNTP